MSDRHEHEVVKDGHRYILRYGSQDTTAAISSLSDWVLNRELNFDWSDASKISYLIGVDITEKLKKFLPKKGE
jgi:hypothetical protein